ncbi:MAG: hypothetical protein NTU95_05940 [Methanothrix sp.]|nr:hypothetical protein [Methanothrix sp.]
MKFTEISGKIALIALAAVCLFAAPALSMPMDSCPGRMGHGGMFAPMNNLTAEEMGNMTLGELKEMERQSWNNTTACQFKEPGQNCSRLGENRKVDGPMNERMGAFAGKDDKISRGNNAPQGMRGASPILLLVDDLTVEDLGNMTVNQIKDLSEKKMQELNNMTLEEVKQLQDKKVQERNNLTLNQLKEENKNMRQMAKIFGWAGLGRHIKA